MSRGNDSGLRRKAADGVCEVDCVDPAAGAGARSAVPPERDLRRAADAFRALAHPGRLRILSALDGRELCVCDVANLLGISMSGASQQLRALRTLGAVDYRASGKLAYYTVSDPFWLEVADTVLRKLQPSEAAARSRRRSVPA